MDIVFRDAPNGILIAEVDSNSGCYTLHMDTHHPVVRRALVLGSAQGDPHSVLRDGVMTIIADIENCKQHDPDYTLQSVNAGATWLRVMEV